MIVIVWTCSACPDVHQGLKRLVQEVLCLKILGVTNGFLDVLQQ